MNDPAKIYEFPNDYNFILTQIFGETTRIKVIEFFLHPLLTMSEGPWAHISQISRILSLSKSSVKNIVDSLKKAEILIEKDIKTHATTHVRKFRINSANPKVKILQKFYSEIYYNINN